MLYFLILRALGRIQSQVSKNFGTVLFKFNPKTLVGNLARTFVTVDPAPIYHCHNYLRGLHERLALYYTMIAMKR